MVKRILQALCVGTCILLTGSMILYAGIWASGEKEWFAEAAGPYRGTTITVVQEGSAQGAMVQNYKEEFEKATGIRVNLLYLSWGDALKKQTADCAAQEGKYDVFYMEGELKGAFASRGWLMPLEQFIFSPLQSPWFKMDDFSRDIFWATALWPNDSPTRYRSTVGRIVGLPFDDAMQLLFYRRDLLEDPKEKANFATKYGYELQLPRTWKEYRDIAEFFTRKPGDTLGGRVLKTGFYGTAIEAQMFDPLTYNFLNWAFSFGGGYFDDDLNVIINTPEVAEALKYYKSLIKFCPPGTLTYTWLESAQAMMQDKIFMALVWNEFAPMMDDPSTSRVLGKVGYALPPVHPRNPFPSPVAGGCSASMSPFSKNPEAAWLWLQWVTGSSLQTEMSRNGALCPPRLSVLADPEVIRLSQDPNNPLRQLSTRAKAIGVRAFRPRLAEWPVVNEIVYLTLHPALTGDKTIAEVLALAETKIEKLNVKAGYQKEIEKFLK